MPSYNPKAIEPRWQQYWLERKTFAAGDDTDLVRLADKTGGWGQIVANQHDSLDDPKPWAESLQRLAGEVAPKVKLPN